MKTYVVSCTQAISETEDLQPPSYSAALLEKSQIKPLDTEVEPMLSGLERVAAQIAKDSQNQAIDVQSWSTTTHDEYDVEIQANGPYLSFYLDSQLAVYNRALNQEEFTQLAALLLARRKSP